MTDSETDVNADVIDRNLLEKVVPEELNYYLGASGWTHVTTQPARYAVWRRAREDGDDEVLVPLDRTFRDYPARIHDAVRTLADVEKRTQLSILKQLGATPLNIIERICEDAKALARTGGAPKRVHIDPVSLWDFAKLSEDQTNREFQNVLVRNGPRAALEEVFKGRIAGLEIVFDGDRLRVE